jgi:hypothetical protein
VLLIQIVAAAVLLLGSGLILRALVEIDRADTPPVTLRRLVRQQRPIPELETDESLPRAA